jgi:hypothetical protein
MDCLAGSMGCILALEIQGGLQCVEQAADNGFVFAGMALSFRRGERFPPIEGPDRLGKVSAQAAERIARRGFTLASAESREAWA